MKVMLIMVTDLHRVLECGEGRVEHHAYLGQMMKKGFVRMLPEKWWCEKGWVY